MKKQKDVVGGGNIPKNDIFELKKRKKKEKNKIIKILCYL